MTRSQIAPALHQVNAERCRPPLPDAEVESIARSIARYEPDTIQVALIEDHHGQAFSPPKRARGKAVELVDPGPVPVEMLRVPGFVGEVMDYPLGCSTT